MSNAGNGNIQNANMELTAEEQELLFNPDNIAEFQRQVRERNKQLALTRLKIAGNIALGLASAIVGTMADENDGENDFWDYADATLDIIDIFKGDGDDDENSVTSEEINATVISKTFSDDLTRNKTPESATSGANEDMSDEELDEWLKDLTGVS